MRTLAVASQKGGVGKTTTVANLGTALVELGRRVVLVDLDPQACLSFSVGLDPDSLELSVHDVLLGRVPALTAIRATAHGAGPDIVPATIASAGSEALLMTRTGREFALRSALADLGQAYDTVLLDCPPALGVLTLNALTAADHVLIPLQCETQSHRGVGQLLDTVGDVQRITNRGSPSWACSPPCTTAARRTPARSSPTSRSGTAWPCSTRRSRGRSGSRRRRPRAARCSRPAPRARARRPTASWRRGS